MKLVKLILSKNTQIHVCIIIAKQLREIFLIIIYASCGFAYFTSPLWTFILMMSALDGNYEKFYSPTYGGNGPEYVREHYPIHDIYPVYYPKSG